MTARKLATVFLPAGLAVMLAAPSAGAHDASATSLHSAAACACDVARVQNGWCEPCSIGWVAGERVSSHELVDALDLPGHPIDVPSLECDGCRAAAVADGICDRCGWGIRGGRIHVSLLSWALAGGGPAGARSACATCRTARETDGWCDGCARGFAGAFAFDDPALHRVAAGEIAKLRTALGYVDRCESCALACFYDAKCPECDIAFEGGEARGFPGH